MFCSESGTDSRERKTVKIRALRSLRYLYSLRLKNLRKTRENSSFEMCGQVEVTKRVISNTNLTHYLYANILDLITE
jgi:hypothetical protein